MPRPEAALLAAVALAACAAPPPARELSWTGDQGGLSDLAADPSDPEGRSFWAVPDRGTTAGHLLLHLRLGADGHLSETGRIPLASGARPFDLEGLASDGADGFWLADEAGAELLHVAPTGRGDTLGVDRGLAPGRGLPAAFARAERNKGFEALCRGGDGSLYALLQGALPEPSGSGSNRRSPLRRGLKIPSGDGKAVPFGVVFPEPDGGRVRIGACQVRDDGTLLLLGHRKQDGSPLAEFWHVDPREASALEEDRASGPTPEALALEPGALERSGVRVATAVPVLSGFAPSRPGWERPEGFIPVPGAAILVVFDNDHPEGGISNFLLLPLPESLRPGR